MGKRQTTRRWGETARGRHCGLQIADVRCGIEGLKKGARRRVQGVGKVVKVVENVQIAAGKPLPQNSRPFTVYRLLHAPGC